MEQEQEKKISVQESYSLANIADELPEEDLQEIAEEVIQGYETDLESRFGWEQQSREYIELASQITKKKTYPWLNAANVNYPLLTTAAVNFASRAYPALIPAYSPVRGRVIGYDADGSKEQRAIRIGKHMSYQLIEEMPDWEDDMDKLCMVLPIVGTAFKKTYYDEANRRNVSELVLPEDLVVDYYAKSLEDAYRKTHKLYMCKNDVHQRIQMGLYSDVELSASKNENDSQLKDQKFGTTPPSNEDDSTQRVILEQHTFLDLDQDGYAEPYIVTVDQQDKKVLRIVARFDIDDVEYNEQGEILYIPPVEYFTKFEFIPSPDGSFYGLGYGPLLSPINQTVNTSINQLLDAGTLSNLPSGFLGRGIKLKGGNTSFKPGEWKSVPSSGADLKSNIVPLPVAQPSATLFNLMGTMINAGERLSSTTDMQVGENPGQNQKATTTMAVLDQSMKVFNAVYKRMHRQLRKEYRKLFRLNRLYLDQEVYFRVLDPRSEQEIKIMQQDYNQEDMDVMPASDPSTSTEQQRLAKAQTLIQMMPLGLNQQEVLFRNLEAMEQPGIERLMDVPPPQPDPAVVLEQQKFEFEQMKFQVETMLRMAAMENQSIKDAADSIAKLMTAEAKEAGLQLDAVKTSFEQLNQEQSQFDEIMKEIKKLVGGEGGSDKGRVPAMEAGQGNEGGTPEGTGS